VKLASLKSASRDGELIVVDRSLKKAVRAGRLAPTLQFALDAWATTAPKLKALAAALESGEAAGTFELAVEALAAPLPRAYQFLDGSVYLHHMQKARKARGVPMPANFETEPLMYQGLSDSFDGPRDPMICPDESLDLDYEPEVAIVVDDVPMGVSVQAAAGHVVLVMLLNDYTYRRLTVSELPKGFGFLQAKPTSAFSPVAVTLDELGSAWDGSKLSLPILSSVNGVQRGSANAGEDMFFSYPQLIAHAARTRTLSAGTIIGAGAVANRNPATGHACIAEMRVDEAAEHGASKTPFLRYGDVMRIDMLDPAGRQIFGAIEQRIAGPNSDRR
jgi:fumarylacetoacetate (FAA) hydrolase